VRGQCPHLDALAGHVTEFAKILTGLRGEQLDAWIAQASAGDQPDLRSFITGLKRDYQAVLNGLTLPYSSGKVEGNVNRIKMLKRQMYAVPDSTCSASESCWHDRSRDHHEMWLLREFCDRGAPSPVRASVDDHVENRSFLDNPSLRLRQGSPAPAS
jgi:hypothetical protein